MPCEHCGSDAALQDGRCHACGAEASPGQTAAPSPPQQPGVPDSEASTRLVADSDGVTIAPATPAGGHGLHHAQKKGPLGVSDTFGSRYHVIRLLGAGGMGSVYQAWDKELEVAVAIKVIRPETMADPAAAQEIEKRFKRELLLARQVTHRNVVRIHDIGEIDGIKYITMPYVQGSDLASILDARGPDARRAGPVHRPAGRVGAGRRARGRRRAPRPEAGQHHDRRRGPRADHGLRHRALDGRRDGLHHDRRRRRHRDAGLHGAGAGEGGGGRSARGRVRVRPDPAGHAAGQPGRRGHDGVRRADVPHEGRAAADARARRRRSRSRSMPS